MNCLIALVLYCKYHKAVTSIYTATVENLCLHSSNLTNVFFRDVLNCPFLYILAQSWSIACGCIQVLLPFTFRGLLRPKILGVYSIVIQG